MAWNRAKKTRPFVKLDATLMQYVMPIIGPDGLAVYMCLKLHHNRRTGQCNPSYQRIAEETGMSRRSVIRYMRLLISLKLVAPTPLWDGKGHRTSNQYCFANPAKFDYGTAGDPAAPKTTSDSVAPPPPEIVPMSHHPSDSLAPQPDELNQIDITRDENAEKTQEKITVTKQHVCPHPTEAVRHLDTDINICNHCFGLLNDRGELVEEVSASADDTD